jgi:D-alanyl-D-alanine carboxypeptidase/D-alanyl-D-alanine-endopeptidase (penicillin-binding protein 4)
VLLLTVALIAGSARADDKLRAEIEKVIQAARYRPAHWGLLVVDLESGKTVYARNADQLFAPASVTKLYTVAAALDALGADYRFATPVYRRGAVDTDGQLRGDLVLVASGDLSLGGRTDADGHIAFTDHDHTYANGNESGVLTEQDPLAGLNELARQVAAAGIKRVRGDVRVDDRLFEKAESTGSGPSRLTPILVNDNLIDLLITPAAAAGSDATVVSRPATAAYQIDARVETVEKGQRTAVRVSAPAPGRIVVRGQIPVGHKPLVRVREVDDAADFARALFIESLRRAGVAVDVSPLGVNHADKLPPADAYAKLPRVALLTSPPFAESIRLILKVSHNLHASTLPLIVAAHKGKRTLDDGLHLQHDFLKRVGVDADVISFGGGAGGSRADYTTPQATVQLLRYMTSRPDFAAYEAGLPVLGVDGTLADALKPDSPARGKVKAKTGTLFWKDRMNGDYLLTSKALAGYLTTAKGRQLAFAFFVNNVHLRTTRETNRAGRTLARLAEVVYHNE